MQEDVQKVPRSRSTKCGTDIRTGKASAATQTCLWYRHSRTGIVGVGMAYLLWEKLCGARGVLLGADRGE